MSAVVGGVVSGLLAVAYNRSPRHASVVIEILEENQEHGAASG